MLRVESRRQVVISGQQRYLHDSSLSVQSLVAAGNICFGTVVHLRELRFREYGNALGVLYGESRLGDALAVLNGDLMGLGHVQGFSPSVPFLFCFILQHDSLLLCSTWFRMCPAPASLLSLAQLGRTAVVAGCSVLRNLMRAAAHSAHWSYCSESCLLARFLFVCGKIRIPVQTNPLG